MESQFLVGEELAIHIRANETALKTNMTDQKCVNKAVHKAKSPKKMSVNQVHISTACPNACPVQSLFMLFMQQRCPLSSIQLIHCFMLKIALYDVFDRFPLVI